MKQEEKVLREAEKREKFPMCSIFSFTVNES
jgi:hypothetical protein